MDDDRDGSEDDEDHEETINEVERLSDKFYKLDNDLEHALFEVVTIEEFHSAMTKMEDIGVISGFDDSVEDIRTAVRETPSEHQEKPEVLKSQFFEDYPISKPVFGRQIVKEIEDNRVPEEIEDLIRDSLELAS